VTSIDFRMGGKKGAGRRSVKGISGRVKKICKGIHSKAVNKRRTGCGVLWIQLMAAHLSKKGDRLFELEGPVIRRSPNGTDGERRTKHVSSNTLFPRGSNPHAVSPTMVEPVRHVSLIQKDIILR